MNTLPHIDIEQEKTKQEYYQLMDIFKNTEQNPANPFERMVNVKQRIKDALQHATIHNQLNDALWPYMPFSLTIGEVLNLALEAVEKREKKK
jgi:hypothetical protein